VSSVLGCVGVWGAGGLGRGVGWGGGVVCVVFWLFWVFGWGFGCGVWVGVGGVFPGGGGVAGRVFGKGVLYISIFFVF